MKKEIKNSQRIFFSLFILFFLLLPFLSFAAPCAGNCRVFGCDFYGEIYHSGDCSYYQNCCIKASELDTSGADPDPIGAGLEVGGTLQNSSAGLGGAAGGTVTPGTSGIPTTSSNATGSTGIRTGSTGGLVPCTDDCTLCHLVLGFKNIYDYLLYIVLLPASILVIVIAGILYMVSSGDKGMIDRAKSALTYALTAMILALLAWLIINATLSALGYKNVGNWYTFTCDTTQTQGPTGGTGAGTLPGVSGTGTGTGTGSGGRPVGTGLVSSGQKTLDQVASNLQAITTYVNYDRNPNGPQGWVDGKFYGDCSSWAQEFYIEAYGIDPGRSTATMLSNANGSTDVNTLKPGDLLIMTGGGSTGKHAGIYMGNEMVISNSGTGTNVVYSNLREDRIIGVIKARS